MHRANDLSVLSRRIDAAEPASDPPALAVPMPRTRWKTRFALPGFVLISVAGLLVYSAGGAIAPTRAVRVVPVVAKSGVTLAGNAVVQAPGWVEGDPYSYAVSALVDGVVREVLVLEGELIEAGQVVARLIDDDARLALAQAEAELAQAEAERQSAEADLSAAQRTWDNPVERVRARDAAAAMLAEKRGELDRFPAELAAEDARAAELEAEYRRVVGLHERDQASEIEMIRTQRQFEAQKALADATRAGRPILEAQLERARAELDAAESNLRLRIEETRELADAKAKLSLADANVARAGALRAEAALRLERMEVRAPSAGVVMNRLVEPGSKLMRQSDMPRSAQIVRLYDPKKLQVRVDVPLGEAAGVGVGQQAEVIVHVLPDRTFQGHVTRVVHEADIQKNTLQVKVAIENPVAEIKPEMLARVRFLAAEKADAAQHERLLAPEELVRKDAGGAAFVWLLDAARSVAERRAVTLGAGREGGWIEIADGLRAGDRLIAGEPEGLRDGSRVRVVGEAVAAIGNGGAGHGAH